MLLVHVRPKLSRVNAHEIYDLIVHIRVNHLSIIGVVVVVGLKMVRVDVVRHVALSGGQLGDIVSLLQGHVPQIDQGRFGCLFAASACELARRSNSVRCSAAIPAASLRFCSARFWTC
jgi:hypothetical protein